MGVLDECHYHVGVENGVSVEVSGERGAIEDAVRVLLLGLGEDINREGLLKTPLRVAEALRDGTRGYHQNVKDIVSGALFPESGLESSVGSAGGAGGLVIVRDLDLFSYCESCLLPFQVKCHVGYVPSGQRVVGLSKLSRVAEVFAKRLQDPQRLANEICAALQHSIKPTGVAVVLQCSHICFPNSQSDPNNHQGCVRLSVMSGSGAFDDEKAGIWTDFLGLLRFRGLTADATRSLEKSWCPSRTICKTPPASDPSLLAAVSSILYALGEDPLREDLVETPARFVNWLVNFKNSNADTKPNGFVRSSMRESSLTMPPLSHICSELNLPFWSQCEHHLLPFHGVVHVGYYSSGRAISTVGKSLLQSVVQFYGFKLQVQERLTRQVAEAASSILGEDVIVVVEASHTCMISRGIEKMGSSTATIAVLGRFSTDPTARAKFLQIIPSSA
ncbi:GTP cyclohydrolase 1-like [Salvia splendens]|uniref:GTP cyclohydrolase 1-like n=1 Tax=Salvia splendens TaxID=180675 RepID=UPI001C252372|nr:GTP cyclohydrolase 1-like [Salvia splendens]